MSCDIAALLCTALHCTFIAVLYCYALYSTVQYCAILHCSGTTVIQCTVYTVLYCVALYCTFTQQRSTVLHCPPISLISCPLLSSLSSCPHTSGPHCTSGSLAYVQCTSPIRRYHDLYNHYRYVHLCMASDSYVILPLRGLYSLCFISSVSFSVSYSISLSIHMNVYYTPIFVSLSLCILSLSLFHPFFLLSTLIRLSHLKHLCYSPLLPSTSPSVYFSVHLHLSLSFLLSQPQTEGSDARCVYG
jgi:hypothetical protein